MSSLSFGVDTVLDLSAPAGATRPPMLAASKTGYVFQASSSVDGTNWGNADQVISTIQSQLVDGVDSVVSSYQNRTATIALRIYARDMDALAAGEAALMLEVLRGYRGDGWNQLSWTPNGASVPTVFDVVTADLQFTLDDLEEFRITRTYSLVLNCLPFPRSAQQVTVSALPAPADGAAPVVTSLDTAASLTGWSTSALVETRRNLCPNPTPLPGSASTAGWAVGSGTARVSVNTGAGAGVTGASAGGVFLIDPKLSATGSAVFTSYVKSTYMAARAGVKYSAQCRTGFFGNAAAASGFLIRFYDAGGNILAQYSKTWNTGRAMTGGSGTWTSPAGTTKLAIFPFVSFTTASGAGSWALDHVLVEQAAAPGSYFDGSSPDTSTTWCRFVGARGASASIAMSHAVPILASGHVQVTSAGNNTVLSRAGALALGGAPFLLITGKVNVKPALASPDVTVTAAMRAAQISILANLAYQEAVLCDVEADGTFVAYFRQPTDIDDRGVYITASSPSAPLDTVTTLQITGISSATGLPVVASGRQSRRQLPVYGATRTQASLRVDTTDASLGEQTLVYSQTAASRGFAYALREAYRTGGPSVTENPAAVSGYVNALASSSDLADVFQIPTTLLADSPQMLYVRIIPTAAATVTFNWSLTLATAPGPVATGTRTVAYQAGAQFVPLGVLNLPRMLDGSADNYVLRLWASSGPATVDDAWLFDTKGSLSVVGTDTRNLLLLNSASLDDPQSSVWTGITDGETDSQVAYAAWDALVWEQHEFTPPGAEVFLVTPGTQNARLELTYYPRWAHHAAPVTLGTVTDPTEPASGDGATDGAAA